MVGMKKYRWEGQLIGNKRLVNSIVRVMNILDHKNVGTSSYQNYAVAIVNYLELNKPITTQRK